MVRTSRLLMSLARWGKWSEKISVKTETVNKKFRYQKYNYKFEINIHVPVNPIQYVEFFNISATRTASF